jgi:hypothetical protein
MKDGHGGVTIGSEISGGARNIFAERCRMPVRQRGAAGHPRTREKPDRRERHGKRHFSQRNDHASMTPMLGGPLIHWP